VTDRPPGFDELVGDVDNGDRARLRRAHRLLVAADAPPELTPRMSPPEVGAVRRLSPPRRLGRPLALAAAVAVTAFALGVATGDRLAEPGTWDVIELTGTTSDPDASATLEVFDLDAAGNWPMELRVRGLAEPAGDRRYELWLTRGGELARLCGTFLVDPERTTTVPMNAPWHFDEFDGWVVVVEGSDEPVLTT